ncbi:CdaR family protein [Terrisporobacter sp.]
MRNRLRSNARIKIISFLSAVVLWMYVMAIVDPEDTKLFEDIPVTVTNMQELEEDDLVVYPESDLVTDIYIKGKLSDLQKLNKDDIHIYGSINNPIEGKNYLYLNVNTTKQVSHEFKSDFIVVKLEKLIHEKKDINTNIVGEYKNDVDTVALQQSTVNISGPRILVEKVNHIKATIQVNSKSDDNFIQRVKLVPVDANGDKVMGVSLDTRSMNAEVTFLEEKNVPINIQSQDDAEDVKSYELNPKEINIRGKKSLLNKINYINTEKVDLSSIGMSKKVNLIIPNGVTSEIKDAVIKPKDEEGLVQRIVYDKDEVELKNNSDDIKASDLNIPDSINVEVQSDTTVSKSDITLYIDLEDSYDENKEYTINYKSDITFKSIKIIPSDVGK